MLPRPGPLGSCMRARPPTHPTHPASPCRLQNQIKSDEEFQAKRSQLREEAKRRLDAIMARKGKRVVWDLDGEEEEDALSIASSELSAWDSDVDSVSSLVSCANDWVQRSSFPSRAEAALKFGCAAALVSGPAAG